MILTETMLKDVSSKFRAAHYHEALLLIDDYLLLAQQSENVDAQCYLYYIALNIDANLANDDNLQRRFALYERLIQQSPSVLERLKFIHVAALMQMKIHQDYEQAKKTLLRLLAQMEEHDFEQQYPNIYISIYAHLMECFMHLEEVNHVLKYYNIIDRIYVQKLLHLDATTYFALHSVLAQSYIEQKQLITAEMIIEDCLSLPQIEQNLKSKGTFLILNSALYALRNDFKTSNKLYEEAMLLVSPNVSRHILNELSTIFIHYL